MIVQVEAAGVQIELGETDILPEAIQEFTGLVYGKRLTFEHV